MRSKPLNSFKTSQNVVFVQFGAYEFIHFTKCDYFKVLRYEVSFCTTQELKHFTYLHTLFHKIFSKIVKTTSKWRRRLYLSLKITSRSLLATVPPVPSRRKYKTATVDTGSHIWKMTLISQRSSGDGNWSELFHFDGLLEDVDEMVGAPTYPEREDNGKEALRIRCQHPGASLLGSAAALLPIVISVAKITYLSCKLNRKQWSSIGIVNFPVMGFPHDFFGERGEGRTLLSPT